MSAWTTEQVLREEAEAIHGTTVSARTLDELYGELNKLNAKALCLSGGGIRSAAFNLGVIQALASWPSGVTKENSADKSFLARFHYLSTVSGGGYIGSWLAAWITRIGFSQVWAHLTGRPEGKDIEPPVVAWLRSYSNYLTPKLGLGSGDTWAAIAVILRNLALMWFVILPVLCIALLIAKAYAFLVSWFSQFSPNDCTWPTHYPALAGAVAVVLALWFVHCQRPSRDDGTAASRAVMLGYVLPAMASGLLFSLSLASQCAYVSYSEYPLLSWSGPSKAFTGMGYGLAIYLAAWLIAFPCGRMWRGVRRAVIERRWGDVMAVWPGRPAWMDLRRDLFATAVAGAVYGFVAAAGLHVYQEYLWNIAFDTLMGIRFAGIKEGGEIFLVLLAVPWSLVAILLADMVFVGLSSHETDADSDREWLGRASGYLMAVALAWLLVMFLVFLAATVATDLYARLWAWLSGIGAGSVAAWLAKSGLTQAVGQAKNARTWSLNLIIAIGAVVFGVLLVVLTSSVLDRVLFGEDLIRSAGFHARIVDSGVPEWPGGSSLWIGLAVAAVLGWTGSYFVNINRFSLHAMYRNRLIRAFLGASHAEKRRANPFTDFDDRDNLRMYELWPPAGYRDEMPGWQPFPVINLSLNVVSTRRLAWQERKAEAFTVSPLHAGSACGRAERGADGVWRAPGAYRPSDVYGDPYGISLGTAMAISGAAANANMGYHTSPAASFLMTMFNVRLGWWLGNPAAASYASEGPNFAIRPFISEMIGNTTDHSEYINLSDGGHFENLGLYEMVRRRCRLIVVCDAGCDPQFAFEDLGNAVRKIALDLGVTITFYGLTRLRTRPQDELEDGIPAGDARFHAIGLIDYGTDQRPGVILYVKAAYYRNVIRNAGVRSYATANPAFPHQSTADQFFSESQFESYRALGFEIMNRVLRRGSEMLTDPTQPTLEDIIDKLREDTVGSGRP